MYNNGRSELLEKEGTQVKDVYGNYADDRKYVKDTSTNLDKILNYENYRGIRQPSAPSYGAKTAVQKKLYSSPTVSFIPLEEYDRAAALMSETETREKTYNEEEHI